jgi:hypothetical protein
METRITDTWKRDQLMILYSFTIRKGGTHSAIREAFHDKAVGVYLNKKN